MAWSGVTTAGHSRPVCSRSSPPHPARPRVRATRPRARRCRPSPRHRGVRAPGGRRGEARPAARRWRTRDGDPAKRLFIVEKARHDPRDEEGDTPVLYLSLKERVSRRQRAGPVGSRVPQGVHEERAAVRQLHRTRTGTRGSSSSPSPRPPRTSATIAERARAALRRSSRTRTTTAGTS